MKIVFFDFVIHYGGGPQLAADTMLRLSKHHDIEVIDPYGQCEPYIRKLQDGGVKVQVLMPESRFVFLGNSQNRLKRYWQLFRTVPHYLRLHRCLQKVVRQVRPDVIWTNSKTGFKFLSVGRSLRHIPLIMEIIGCHPASYFNDFIGHKMKKRLSLVMAISTETSNQLKASGFNPDKIHIVFDTIDFEETLRRSRLPLDAPLPCQGKHPAILVPATLIPKKGHDTAIKAVARLKQAGMDPVLWLAGDVVGLDHSYELYLKALVDQMKLNENVFFLGWRHDVPAIIVNADMVVLPTHEEGFGHVILESMLLKRPALATPVGGILDSIQNGINGLLFPVQDDECLAEQIMRIQNDPSLARQIVDQGFKTVTERFTPQAHTERCLESLRKLMS